MRARKRDYYIIPSHLRADQRRPALLRTKCARGHMLAPQFCSMIAGYYEEVSSILVRAVIGSMHSTTSVQATNACHDTPSDSNQSCQSTSPSMLLLTDTTCSRSNSERHSPPKSAKRKRAEELLEQKYARRGKSDSAREMMCVGTRHENVEACSSSEQSGCSL